MAIERLRFADEERWGKLVKTWATGTNYLQDGKSYPIPRTLAEFKQQCSDAQVGATIPAHVTGLTVTQTAKEVLFLRLPPKEMVEDSEQTLQTQPYTLPKFYNRIFGGVDPSNVGDKLRLHAERIGDYTMSNCV
jgi:hypothetical protein